MSSTTETTNNYIVGRKVVAYLAFTKNAEVDYESGNAVAVDVNENNVTVAVFKSGGLAEVYRLETSLGRIVIAYAERRKRIAEGKSTKAREVKKKLRKLRERGKLDILRKTAKLIEELATKNKAVVVVGNISRRAKEKMGRDKGSKLRHRIHQWNASTMVKLLEEKPIHVAKVSEAGTSSRDPFTGTKINSFKPLMIRYAAKGVVKLVLRVTKVRGGVLERDVVGAINIGLKHLTTNGSLVALGSTGTHEVRVKLMNPHRSTTPLTNLQIFNKNQQIPLAGKRRLLLTKLD